MNADEVVRGIAQQIAIALENQSNLSQAEMRVVLKSELASFARLLEAAELITQVDGPDRTWQERQPSHRRLHEAIEGVRHAAKG